MKAGKTIAVLIAAAAVCLAATSGFAAKRSLRIGLAFKFTERYDGTVPSMTRGAEVARAMFTERHKGFDVKFERFTHDAALETAIAAANAAVQAKVDAVIGGEDSQDAIAIGGILDRAGIVFVSPTATNPRVTEGKPLAFGASMSDELVGRKIAGFVAGHLKAQDLGVMHGVSWPYTDFLSKTALDELAAVSARTPGTPLRITHEKFIKGALSFDDAIKRLQAAKATHVVMTSYETALLQLVNQARAVGYEPALIGADGWGDASVLRSKIFSDAKSGLVLYQTAYWREDADHAVAAAFRKRYQAMFGAKPDAWAAIAFDAAWVLLEGFRTAKAPASGPDVAAAMAALGPIEVATTRAFKFNASRSPEKDLPFYRIDASGIRYEASY